MGWTMGDEALKVQLFRFVDALPRLHDPAAIAGHLREYLGEAGDAVPWWVRCGVRLLPERGLGGRAAGEGGQVERASGWPAGSSPGRTSPRRSTPSRGCATKSLAFTIDLLGEATITEAEADHVQKQYLDLIAGLTPRGERLAGGAR